MGSVTLTHQVGQTAPSKRKLGPFEVHPIGLGCMGMSEFYGPTDESRSIEVLEQALDLGVDHFDTADIYGHGHNEELLGKVLCRSSRRDKVVLATKCGIVRDKDDPSRRGIDNTPAYIKRACDRSLKRLETHIDIFYLHRISDYGRRIEESMSAMAELLESGKIRAVGVSEASAQTINNADCALRLFTNGKHGLAAVQTEYSLMSRDIESNGILKACEGLGVSVVAYSPIGRGLLSGVINNTNDLDKNDFRLTLPRFSQDALQHNALLAKEVAKIAREIDATPSQVAIAWLLHRSSRVFAIPGTKRTKYLEENMGASRITLKTDVIARIDDLLGQIRVEGSRYAPDVLRAYGLDAK